jgi:hypothetical protein
MSSLRIFIIGLLATIIAAAPATAQQRQAAPARDLSIKAFFGTFTGTGLAKTEDSQYFGVTVRDLDAKIEGTPGDGFKITWTSVIRSGGDPARPRVRRREASLEFVPTKLTPAEAAETGVKTETLGFRGKGAQIGDPIDGKFQTWARIRRNTLLIHILQINEEGGYDLETYARTLSGAGMDLIYSRERDGEQLRSVKGKLIKNAG